MDLRRLADQVSTLPTRKLALPGTRSASARLTASV